MKSRLPVRRFFTVLTSGVVFVLQVFAGENPDSHDLSLAQLMNLDVTVITSSRKEDPIDLAPNDMYVVTRDEIKKRAYRNLEDVLTAIPGFKISMGHGTTAAQIRGIAPNDNNKITIMVNGHSINIHIEGFDFHAISMDNVERIEIIVGPGSVLYGSETLVATINLITKSATKNEIALCGGTYNYIAPSLVFGKTWEENRSITVSGNFKRFDGWDAFTHYEGIDQVIHPNDSGGFDTIAINENLAGTNSAGSLRAHYMLIGHAQYDNWSMQYVSNHYRFDEPNTIRVDGVEDAVQANTVNSFLVRNETSWTDTWSTFIEMFYDTKRYVRAVKEGRGDVFDLSQNILGGECAVRFKTNRNYLQWGIQGKYKLNEENYMLTWAPDDPADTTSSAQSLLRINNTKALGFYIQDDFQIIEDRLKAVLAFRVDKDEILSDPDESFLKSFRKDWHFVPRAALIGIPVKNYWTTKFMFNGAVGMPNAWSSYGLNNLWGSDNPYAPGWAADNPLAKKPEKLWAIELQNIVYFLKTRVSVVTYWQKLTDYITWSGPFTNVGDFTGIGIELDIKKKIADRANVWGNFSFAEAEFKQESFFSQDVITKSTKVVLSNDKGEALGVPKIIGNLGVDYTIIDNLFLSIDVNGFTKEPAFDPLLNKWLYVNNKMYCNAAFTWENCIIENLDWTISGKNLFNNTHRVAVQALTKLYRPRGIAGLLSVRYRF